MWRILPSCCSATSSPIWSSSGNLVSMRCSWNRSMRSTPSVAQAHLAFLTQVWREAQHRPLIRPGAQQPGLGGDDQVVGVGVQRLADQLLGHVRPVRVGGVDEVDAHFDGAAQYADAFVVVGGRAPDALAGEAHCAESQAVDGQVAADDEGPRFPCYRSRGHPVEPTPKMSRWACETQRPRRLALDLCRGGRDRRAAARGLPPPTRVGCHRARASPLRGGGRRGNALGHAARRRGARGRDDAGRRSRLGGHRPPGPGRARRAAWSTSSTSPITAASRTGRCPATRSPVRSCSPSATTPHRRGLRGGDRVLPARHVVEQNRRSGHRADPTAGDRPLLEGSLEIAPDAESRTRSDGLTAGSRPETGGSGGTENRQARVNAVGSGS